MQMGQWSSLAASSAACLAPLLMPPVVAATATGTKEQSYIIHSVSCCVFDSDYSVNTADAFLRYVVSISSATHCFLLLLGTKLDHRRGQAHVDSCPKRGGGVILNH